jgi:rhodanese-related sulfurtransferase
MLEQAGRKAELVPGSRVFYDTSEPFALRFDEPWEQVVIHVPVEQALASAGLKRSADLVAVPLDGGGAAGAAAAFLRSLAFAQRDDPGWRGSARAIRPWAAGV